MVVWAPAVLWPSAPHFFLDGIVLLRCFFSDLIMISTICDYCGFFSVNRYLGVSHKRVLTGPFWSARGCSSVAERASASQPVDAGVRDQTIIYMEVTSWNLRTLVTRRGLDW